MIREITQELTGLLQAEAGRLECRAGRAADRDAALLWLWQHTANAWGVCVTVSDTVPEGPEQERRAGRSLVTVRLYIGVAPGLPADADKRAEDLQQGWEYVRGIMERVRWGTKTEDGGFVGRSGFLDGHEAMMPGPGNFSRVRLKVTGADGKEDVKELLLGTQEWSVRVSFPVIGPAGAAAGDFFLDGTQTV